MLTLPVWLFLGLFVWVMVAFRIVRLWVVLIVLILGVYLANTVAGGLAHQVVGVFSQVVK